MWHYVEGEESRGPVSEPAMAALIEARTVQPDSLVWREGLSDWLPASDTHELADRFPTETSALQLRTAPRSFDTAESDEANEAISVADLRAPLEAMAEAENAQPDSTWLGWMVFTGPLEFRIFLFTALLAGIATIGMQFYDPGLLALPFAIQGIVCLGVGGIIFRVRTFQAGVGWGIAGLLIGITDLVFIFTHWSRAKHSVLLQLTGIAVIAAVLFAGASLAEMIEAVPLEQF